ncbi:MAG: HAD family hydrolase [Campylobacterales bacterium]|nr:HAD family hydrolase [Campylobacterales bacterium]
MTILFDLDGTLIDSTDAILESFAQSYHVWSRPCPPPEQIKALIGYPLDIMFARLGIEEAMVWPFVEQYKAHYREISREKTVMLPRAIEAVERAAEHAQLGIVTTKTARYSRELLEHFGLMHHFKILIGREDVEHPKPHPEPVLKAMAHILTCKPERTWLIGDTRLDLEAAQRAGIKGVAVLSGYDNYDQLLSFTNIIKTDALEAVDYIIGRGSNRDM